MRSPSSQRGRRQRRTTYWSQTSGDFNCRETMCMHAVSLSFGFAHVCVWECICWLLVSQSLLYLPPPLYWITHALCRYDNRRRRRQQQRLCVLLVESKKTLFTSAESKNSAMKQHKPYWWCWGFLAGGRCCFFMLPPLLFHLRCYCKVIWIGNCVVSISRSAVGRNIWDDLLSSCYERQAKLRDGAFLPFCTYFLCEAQAETVF